MRMQEPRPCMQQRKTAASSSARLALGGGLALLLEALEVLLLAQLLREHGRHDGMGTPQQRKGLAAHARRALHLGLLGLRRGRPLCLFQRGAAPRHAQDVPDVRHAAARLLLLLFRLSAAYWRSIRLALASVSSLSPRVHSTFATFVGAGGFVIRQVINSDHWPVNILLEACKDSAQVLVLVVVLPTEIAPVYGRLTSCVTPQ
jgi:hypothetical protein